MTSLRFLRDDKQAYEVDPWQDVVLLIVNIMIIITFINCCCSKEPRQLRDVDYVECNTATGTELRTARELQPKEIRCQISFKLKNPALCHGL